MKLRHKVGSFALAVATVPAMFGGAALATPEVVASGAPPTLSTVSDQVASIGNLMLNTTVVGGLVVAACIGLSLAIWGSRHLGHASKGGSR